MFSPHQQARRLQHQANERERDDVSTQHKVIVIDLDGERLFRELMELGNANRTPRLAQDMRFSFMGEDTEALLSRLDACESGVIIDMPGCASIRRLEGFDLDTWVFRVDNEYDGVDREYFDLAFRRIDTGDYLLYLKHHESKRVRSR